MSDRSGRPDSQGSARPPEPLMRGDRPYTFRITFICLGVGIALALLVGALLLALRQPLATNATGGVTWSIGAFMVPAAGLVTVTILAWSVFFLPLAVARRQGMVLDPQVWPVTGAIAIGILVIVGFVGAMVLNVI